MSTINAATQPPACPGRNVAGAAHHGAVHPSAVRLNLPRLGLYDQTSNAHSNSKPMKFEHGHSIKAEAKDEESDEYRQNLNLTQHQTRASTLPNMNTNMNMNQTMPLMDSEISLTVPMSRKNAAIITSTRLKRLKTLSSAKEEQLTGGQQAEKKRIIRLEKNRRAAAMSRKKKKVYIRDLEENSKLMERHLAILKMENDHLRALLAANMQQQAQQAQQMMAQQAQAQQQIGRANSQPAPAPTSNANVNANANAPLQGLQAPPIMPPNPAKRRRLNDGSASTTATSTISSTATTSLNSSINDEMGTATSIETKDPQILQPLSAESEMAVGGVGVVEKPEMEAMAAPPPPPPMNAHAMNAPMNPPMNAMMHPMAGHAMHGMLNQSMPNLQRLRMMPNMFHGHPMPMHPQMQPQMPMNPMMMAQMNAGHPMPPPPQTMAPPQTMPPTMAQPQIQPKMEPKIEVMSEQKMESPDKLMPMPLPPAVLGVGSDNEDFGVLPFLDESLIEETVDECGGVGGFAATDNGFVI